jgi:transcriptional regulator with XRE-family HTH domain
MKKPEYEFYPSMLAMAKAFGVHRNTVSRWERTPGFPERTGRGYPKEEVNDWVESHEKPDEDSDTSAGAGTREEKTALECKLLKIRIEKERELLEQAREETRKQIETGKVATGKLIEKREVVDGLIKLAHELKSAIESWAKSAEADDPTNADSFERAKLLYLEKINERISSLSF